MKLNWTVTLTHVNEVLALMCIVTNTILLCILLNDCKSQTAWSYTAK